MKFINLLLTGLLLVSCTTAEPQTDEEAIQQCFDSYQEAVKNRNGNKAVKWIDGGTIAKYEKYIDYALKTEWDRLSAFSMIDKLIVLTIRNNLSKEQVYKMTGKKLFAYGVNKGFFGTEDIALFELGELKFNGNNCAAVLVIDGAWEAGLNFVKEEGKWKVFPQSLYPYTVNKLAKIMDDNSRSEDGVMMGILKEQNDGNVSNEIFKPMAPK